MRSGNQTFIFIHDKEILFKVCDGISNCPLTEAGAGGEDEENCDNHEGRR